MKFFTKYIAKNAKAKSVPSLNMPNFYLIVSLIYQKYYFVLVTSFCEFRILDGFELKSYIL